MSFVQSTSRNHLVFTDGCLDGFQYVNVGLELSTQIEDLLSHRRLSLKAQDIINDLFSKRIMKSEHLGSYLALQNIGILFEPLLRFDLEALFNKWSQNHLLVIDRGKGCVRDERFFLVENRDVKFSVDLSSLNYFIL